MLGGNAEMGACINSLLPLAQYRMLTAFSKVFFPLFTQLQERGSALWLPACLVSQQGLQGDVTGRAGSTLKREGWWWEEGSEGVFIS